MEKLQRFYRYMLRSLVVAIVGAAVAYHVWLIPRLKFMTPETAKAVGSFVIPGIFFLGEWVINKHLWKLFFRGLNVSGDWVGTTVYETAQIPRPGLKHEVFAKKDHSVKIEQDCFSVSIITTDEGFNKWSSIVMTFQPPFLSYAYEVRYNPEDHWRFPERAIGYEKMEIVRKKNESPNSWPRKLRGDFWHCAMGQTPVYSGSVTFRRSKSKQEQLVDDLNRSLVSEVTA